MPTVDKISHAITSLGPNEIFVFGSNRQGVHGAGAALAAANKFGAQMLVGEGLTGRCYALPTLDFDRAQRQLSAWELQAHIETFVEFARTRPDLIFMLTRVGCGLAGQLDSFITGLFPANMPQNIKVPPEWEEEFPGLSGWLG